MLISLNYKLYNPNENNSLLKYLNGSPNDSRIRQVTRPNDIINFYFFLVKSLNLTPLRKRNSAVEF